MKEKLKRSFEFHPAFDRRDPDPKKNYGIQGMEMKFLLTGKKGVVQFVIFTNWHLPHVTEELLSTSRMGVEAEVRFLPMGADLGYHAPIAQYEGQEPLMKDCPYIGGPCYYDGSGLAAEGLLETLISQGDKPVWAAMEERYNRIQGAV